MTTHNDTMEASDMRAYGAVLIPAGAGSRSGEQFGDICWAPDTATARALLAEIHPHARVLGLTDLTEKVAA